MTDPIIRAGRRLTPVQREILTALADGAEITGTSCLDYAIDGRPIACRTLSVLVERDLVDCYADFDATIHAHPITERGLAAIGRAAAEPSDGRTG